MRSQAQRERDVESELLASTFDYLVNNGLENFSMRELCKATGISIGSIYYWFDNKDELIICAVQYGLSKVSEEIFDFAFETIGDLEEFFENCLKEIQKSVMPLRLIYQISTSPRYGKTIRENTHSLCSIYTQYAERLSVIIGCDAKELEPVVHIFISVIMDYVICENYEITKMEIEYLHSIFRQLAEKAAIKQC